MNDGETRWKDGIFCSSINDTIPMETCIGSKSADRLVRIFVPGILAKP